MSEVQVATIIVQCIAYGAVLGLFTGLLFVISKK